MPEISKIKLPSGSVYDIKDAVAREAIAGGVTFIVAWDGTTTPNVTGIPAGVKVTYNDTVYTGTLSAETTGSGTHAQAGAFYLVRTSTAEYVLLTAAPSDWSTNYTDYYTYNSSTGVYSKVTGASAPTWAATTYYKAVFDIYDEYVPVGTTGSKYWEKIGDTQVDLSNVVTGVTLNKSANDVLGKTTSFTTTVTPTTTNIKATASGAAVGADGTASAVTGYANPSTDTFVKSVSAETNKKLVVTSITPTNGTETVSKVTKAASKLVTTSIPNVTSAGSASTWSFTMGSGDASETLIIDGGNSTAPTLGTAITAATGAVDANGAGSDIVTSVTISDKTVAKQGSSVTVATGATAADGTGDSIVTGVTIGSSASALTGLGTPSTATVLTGVKVTSQPTVALATGATAGDGVISVATGITSASTTAGENNIISALNNTTSITVTKGSNS